MQSTPSRARHSSSIFAPLSKFDVFAPLGKFEIFAPLSVDICCASQLAKNEKRPSARLSAPLMASESYLPAASDGAGYDDYEQNNNAYRDSNDTGEKGTKKPACKSSAHR